VERLDDLPTDPEATRCVVSGETAGSMTARETTALASCGIADIGSNHLGHAFSQVTLAPTPREARFEAQAGVD
jgi:hypothetical protein